MALRTRILALLACQLVLFSSTVIHAASTRIDTANHPPLRAHRRDHNFLASFRVPRPNIPAIPHITVSETAVVIDTPPTQSDDAAVLGDPGSNIIGNGISYQSPNQRPDAEEGTTTCTGDCETKIAVLVTLPYRNITLIDLKINSTKGIEPTTSMLPAPTGWNLLMDEKIGRAARRFRCGQQFWWIVIATGYFAVSGAFVS